MRIDQWKSHPAVVVGPSGATTEALVSLPVPPDPSLATVVTLVLALVMLVFGTFVPPLLLLNIPILLVRTAFTRASLARYELVRLDLAPCPACAEALPQTRIPGTLPVELSCAACGAALVVQRRPRRNLVAPAPGATWG